MTGQGGRPLYRLYWVDRFGSVDAAAKPFDAPCDVAAIRRAEAMAEGDRAELWQAARLVVEIGPAAAFEPRPGG